MMTSIQPRVVEQNDNIPRRIAEIHYSVMPNEMIHRLSVLPCRRSGPTREFGVNDPRLGVCDRVGTCATCGLKQADCAGHGGHVNLDFGVFHLGYLSTTIRICRTICKTCSAVLLSPEEKQYYGRKFAGKLDPLQRSALTKTVQTEAYKTRVCPYCGSFNGVVRRVRPMKIVHEKYGVKQRRNEEGMDPRGDFFNHLVAAEDLNPEVATAKLNAQDFLDPARVWQLFAAIPREDVILLGTAPETRPEDLIVRAMFVPPVCTRPSGPAQGGRSRDDDLSLQYNDILTSVEVMRDGGLDPTKFLENWDMLQLRVARLLDGALPGFPQQLKGPPVKSYAQRMKGKHGRFRGNLSGKRVDFSGRSVISPDPNLDIDELAIPLRMARVLTYPQRVNAHNVDLMRRLVLNGPDCHPGAVSVTFVREGVRKNLQYDREANAAKLSIGDIVERHVMNGDLVLFNRQPSLHRISMMCHRARVLPFRTLRFNECCCAPYNADFDGDEMNVHLVQTEEARAEAQTLMLTARNIITAKNGEPIIACIQDFLTASYLATSRDIFLNRAQFCQGVSNWLRPGETFDLPMPAVLKPEPLWTGKQLYEVIVRPRTTSTLSLNFEAAAKYYNKGTRHDCPDDGFIIFCNSHMVCGRFDKKVLGGGAKDGLFARLHASGGGPYAAQVMNRIARFSSRYLMNYGFSLGIGDVFPTPSLEERKRIVLDKSFALCHDMIRQANSGKMEPLPGMTVAQTLESRLNGELSEVRERCGNEAVRVLTSTNAPLIMAQSGSKGSTINVAQMMAVVGQQTVTGKRIQNAFVDRSLPHFYRFAEHPAARGFVANSFYSGLTPTEFFFHTMAGREGLVDTAVKTAETGYIYRRLMKAMEDLSIKYDHTVRNSKGDIVQLHFGEDMLDPQLMEGANGAPVNFRSLWLDVVNNPKFREEPPMPPSQVVPYVKELIETLPCFKRCSSRFKGEVIDFWQKRCKEADSVWQRLGADPLSRVDECPMYKDVLQLSRALVLDYTTRCGVKYMTKICEPGTPCGAIAAQSVGEPSTQMTLRTFHFAGVASMSITQGVPRLVEIINANKSIATPVIRAPLTNSTSQLFAAHVKASIETVRLKEVARDIVEVVSPGAAYLRITLNRRLINDLQLNITAHTVKQRMLALARKPLSPLKNLTEGHVTAHNKDVLDVTPFDTSKRALHNLKQLVTLLPETVVGGVAGINRAIITRRDTKAGPKCEILAEGAELRSVMVLPGVDGARTTCNHVAAVEKVLGIEAARQTIVSEIQSIMQAYSLSIDIRHVFLLADVMTHRGQVLGITRYGIQKMNSGVLTMASFERTTEHLYDAAVFNRADKQLSVSENIIVGAPIPLGTNGFHLMYKSQGKSAAVGVGSPSRRLPPPRPFHPLADTGAFSLDLPQRSFEF